MRLVGTPLPLSQLVSLPLLLALLLALCAGGAVLMGLLLPVLPV